MLGGVIILLLIGISLFADALAPYPYNKIHLRDRMQEASAQYLLGTDHVGRDLLSRLIHGARISLGVGLAATTLNALVALLVGGVSGFLGRKLDLAMQRLVDGLRNQPLFRHRGSPAQSPHRPDLSLSGPQGAV